MTRAILGVRARGGIVVVVAHRPSAVAGVDQLLVMRGGRQHAFGPKDAVIKEAMKAAQAAQPANPGAAPVAAPVAGAVPASVRVPTRGRDVP